MRICIINVCGQKAKVLLLNVAVYAQNIVFTEKTAWALHKMNLIRGWWGIRWGLHGRLEGLDNTEDVFLKVAETCPRKYIIYRQKQS